MISGPSSKLRLLDQWKGNEKHKFRVASFICFTCLFHCVFWQAVKKFLKQECKCHGVSGSCTLRTCWLAMADFRKTGDYLWKKYEGAIQVVMNQDGTGFTVANKRFKRPTKNDLVYFESSPDYCIRDRDIGKLESPHAHGFISVIVGR